MQSVSIGINDAVRWLFCSAHNHVSLLCWAGIWPCPLLLLGYYTCNHISVVKFKLYLESRVRILLFLFFFCFYNNSKRYTYYVKWYESIKTESQASKLKRYSEWYAAPFLYNLPPPVRQSKTAEQFKTALKIFFTFLAFKILLTVCDR